MRNNHLEPGDVVSVRFGGALRHYGVVTSSGRIICNSRAYGGVIEQSYEDFSDGRHVRVHRKPRGANPYSIEHRARRRMGRDYDLTGSNCIDLARHAHKRRPTPWITARATLMALEDMMGKRRR